MTRDQLTPSMSTIVLKSTFSIAVNILGERTIRISDEMFEILTSLKDWEAAHFKLQKEEDEYERMLENLDLNTKQDNFKTDDDN